MMCMLICHYESRQRIQRDKLERKSENVICSDVHRTKAYLDQTETGIAAVLQTTNAELDIRQVEPVR